MSVVNFLLNGPIMKAPERRQALVERMAKDINRYQVAGNRQDAIRILHCLGYSTMDIDLLVDEARAHAFQEAVAEEMSRP